ncbi:hypothetical protein [Clostridium autoethanogenum]|uniref:Uncharacterized protein n=1 Tax=Clostridium autoethanogenum DSM 10061 TaxID=1341692 RepID=A0ABM5NZI1_9CLOT|nr:hypothetical protein [Clostridium autoethanogenum]AGY77990.1 hypothetical protein CAETHG_3789 [Clostridium autoethanogenum DSM 10061]ALU38124.1 Hypothetical protein CLAU_3697 [Clostridium autoethanogenum DSM 10061]OVY50888.1 hypothetical protein WX72_02049 [Clostridium autoethanogenum]
MKKENKESKTAVKNKKLTIKDLIAKKIAKKNNQHKVVEIEVGEGEVMEFITPTQKEVFDYLDELDKMNADNSVSTNDVVEVYADLIYKQCPSFHDKELIESVKEEMEGHPESDIVLLTFERLDITKIGDKLIATSGIDMKKLQNEVKN